MEPQTPPPLPPSIPASPSAAPAFAPLTAAQPKPRLWQRPGFRRAVYFTTIFAIIGGCAGLYARASHYGKQVVEAHPVDARIEIANSPAYLDPRIINSLLAEAYAYAQQDQSTYDRTRNTLDASVLHEYADLYTGTQQTADGQLVARQSANYNAWIKSITAVRRVVASDKSIQTIQIFAEWRVPVAWVRVGDNLYLIDVQGTRLPGDYTLADHAGSKLLVISGVEGTFGGGTEPAPKPGEIWSAPPPAPSGTNTLALGADLVAGLQLADILRRQPYAGQIGAINVANMRGRRDALAPWVDLETIFPTAAGMPRVVHWGRPPGEEYFYDVKADVKLKSLGEIYQRFNRIDANRDYVDIRTEVIRLPKLALGT